MKYNNDDEIISSKEDMSDEEKEKASMSTESMMDLRSNIDGVDTRTGKEKIQ